MTVIKKVAVLGAGVIGAGWIARFAENGVTVGLFDPAPDARQKVEAVLSNAEYAYSRLEAGPRVKKGSITYAATLAEAVVNADLIVEAVPEVLSLKQSVYRDVEKCVAADVIIVSSTSGILPTDLQAGMDHPERLLVAHPFNPVYLLPLVEIVAGEQTAADVVEKAIAIYTELGMEALHIKKEIEAFVADRLLEAVWRESLWLIKDGIATTEEIDDAIRFGFGLRWAQMGLFETYRLAGGEAGMKHFIAQFGPCLQWPWTKLMDVPELTEELIDTIATQSEAQSGHYSFRQLERIRDDNLIAIMHALKTNNWGAGQTLIRTAAIRSQRLANTEHAEVIAEDINHPLLTLECAVSPEWTDYNNHMTESRYLQCFGDATDGLLQKIGVDADYVANGGSYFTVETHIRHLDEVKALELINVTTQVLAGKGKKCHVFHRLSHADGRMLATAEQLLIHVDMDSRSACEPTAQVTLQLEKIAAAHASLALPDGCGRAIGDPL
ncbi:3-hydroxybutyryl-CoA dehydrogenase [marine gamma proteobacterium HTCC2143]|uniref:L-carnitine dehydrogenase n=1 Tax=marine gamma proteobacterium HTCC2143 TaxID=247633 RepID=A0YBI1_9GAMM|nr:3-hydroxybutyryl-CoA dehydrogenase [marine gamma proteobacterium HTCC2143]